MVFTLNNKQLDSILEMRIVAAPAEFYLIGAEGVKLFVDACNYARYHAVILCWLVPCITRSKVLHLLRVSYIIETIYNGFRRRVYVQPINSDMLA